VDVGKTTSSIILGEDHQVTTSINNIQDKLAPISFVVGLATFNGAETGEQLAFIGDSLIDWYYNGKILGVNVSGTDDGGTKVTAQQIDVSGFDETGVKSALKTAGFSTPDEGDATLSSIIEEYRNSIEDAASKLATLAAQMAQLAGEDVDQSQEEGTLTGEQQEPTTGPITTNGIAGTYSATAWVLYTAEDVEAEDMYVTLQLNEGGTGTANVNGFSGDAVYAGNSVKFSVTMTEGGYAVSCVFDGTASQSGSQASISGTMQCSIMGVTLATYSWTAQK
jgi:hypothetical protein